MDVAGSVALVTGANRGLGAAFCRALLAQGASKVYAGARDPATVTIDGVVPVRLDITSPTDVAAAAAQCGDVSLLVNNAGILTGTSALAEAALEEGRREFETNVFGTLAMSRGVRAGARGQRWRGARERAVGAVVVQRAPAARCTARRRRPRGR